MKIKTISGLLAAMMFSGCMGHNALTQKVVKWNLETAESRWGREGIFVGLWITLVYPICAFLDLLVFNSIEFWSGENNLNGKSPVVDMPKEEVQKLGLHQVDRARVERLTDTSANLYIDFENGDSATFDVIRTGSSYAVSYRGVEFYQGKVSDS
ncbi:DUF3332 family protein [Pontiella sulfatireligans]|uniref:DUF3332 domain-containing protein n=1 Tax=Pontiella sulfatireligans TaxID=2750658 RepID=A0A6C2UX66_9BACT|nr:DUF3332 family protein [Pontiella sulfatireligans]VGO23446.1 hypothetical protein SCARR_05553 [Pontiella sulfatireligans]